MARLTATELGRLGNIQPELMQLLVELVDEANAAGYVTAVPPDGGVRTPARQAELYADSLAQGGGVLAYPVGTPGTSYHEIGAAFDLHIIAGGQGENGVGDDYDYQQLADMARRLVNPPGLRAGYYFSHSDPYHFELDEPRATAAARYVATSRLGFGAGLVIAGVSALVLAVVLQRR